jgi:hypothetical protein
MHVFQDPILPKLGNLSGNNYNGCKCALSAI